MFPDFRRPVNVAPHLRARGVDLSSNQSVTQSAAVLNGIAAYGHVDFAIVKASQGVHYVNPLLEAQLGLVTKPMVKGLYHFLDGTDGARQWDHFEQAAGAHAAHCLIAVDYESSGLPVNTPGDAICRTFIRRGRQRGYHVGLYGSANVASRNLGQAWTWAAWWSGSPPPFRWDVWQFADHPVCDWNVFRGDQLELTRFAAKYGHRTVAVAPLRWWLHDETAKTAVGPFPAAAVVAARFVAYALRHPRSNLFTIRRG
jgi:GH25 family lysozyme M1 (1,4-beta-N-acetylmuramidase)